MGGRASARCSWFVRFSLAPDVDQTVRFQGWGWVYATYFGSWDSVSGSSGGAVSCFLVGKVMTVMIVSEIFRVQVRYTTARYDLHLWVAIDEPFF